MANVSFHIGTKDPTLLGTTIEGGIYVNQTGGGIYYAPGGVDVIPIASKVQFTQLVTTGTKLGTIKINGASKDLYYRNTLNTAGGTATNEKLFFVGMKSDNVDNAQTYTNSYCYAQGNYLYSNQQQCANLCSTRVTISIPHSGNSGLPIAKGDSASYYRTISGSDIGGAFVGYEIGEFDSGYSGGSWTKIRLGVEVGATTSGGIASYKLGVKLTANSTLPNNAPLLSEGSIKLIVYYIPF